MVSRIAICMALFEILIETERHVVRRVLGARRGELHALVQDELQNRGVRRLDSADRHFAIALCSMRIAGEEQSAGVIHRQEQRRARDELLAIQIAAERTGRTAASIRTFFARRQQAHHTHERAERHFDAGVEDADVALQHRA